MTSTHPRQSSHVPDGQDLTDGDLRHRLRAGDAAALAELPDRCWTPLVRLVAAWLQDADAAEDVAQDAFVRLWQARGRLNHDGSLEALLFRIARNAARDHDRKRRTRERWARLVGTAPPDPPLGSDAAEEAELQEAVNRAVAALPARRREVFLLLRTTPLTHREVAALLGITPQTVSNVMTRVLDDLRAALAPYLDPPPSNG